MSTPPASDHPKKGPAFLSHGFRPFFFFAGIWAALAVLIWVLAFAGAIVLPSAFDPLTWHVHEMVFGYAAAAIAGFLFTAVPNWTGRSPVHGLPLAGFAALWLAGRIAVLCGELIGAWPAAIIDGAFLIVLAAVIGREIVLGKNRRNLVVVAVIAVLATANILTHLEPLGIAATGSLGLRLGIGVVITLIGGRVTPSFTASWLGRQGVTAPDIAVTHIDRVGLVAVAAAMIAWTVVPEARGAGWLLWFAGALTLYRLARWRPDRTLGEPLVWVLHLGYAWLAAGLLLLGASVAFDGLSTTAALHALTAGAIGTMPLAVMSRATLGHSGRPLTATRVTTVLYLCASGAAILRVVSPILGTMEIAALHLSAALWIIAFGGFALTYAPLFFAPRTDAE
ncbi:MAG: NnrS family protein [Proteobacteria bacterium]|nr:NnrS family protein [Pseudomonadota bacterium]MDA1058649.1 NnrS family protein [Pseudomonadota bacterium]